MSFTTESLGTKRKVFWTVFMALGAVAVADFSLPLWWALAATVPIGLQVGGWHIAATGSKGQLPPFKSLVHVGHFFRPEATSQEFPESICGRTRGRQLIL